jgi:hypothetical protein
MLIETLRLVRTLAVSMIALRQKNEGLDFIQNAQYDT